jgi:hypothetical protein
MLIFGPMKGDVICLTLKGLKLLEHNFEAQPIQITVPKPNDTNLVHIADEMYCFERLFLAFNDALTALRSLFREQRKTYNRL